MFIPVSPIFEKPILVFRKIMRGWEFEIAILLFWSEVLDFLRICGRVVGRIGELGVAIPGFIAAGEILKSGIYALLYRGEVIYIGQSKSMLVRIYTHKASARGKSPSWSPIKGIVFDDVHIRPCHVDKLDDLEYEMINLYKPRYNSQLKHSAKSRAEFTLEINGVALTINKPPAPRPQIERRI